MNHDELEQYMYYYMMPLIQFVFFTSVFLRGCVGQLLLPHVAGCILVQAGEKDVEHIRVPSYSMALDTFLDILHKIC